MTAIVITPSVDPGWVRPVASLRARGIGSVAITIDAAAADALARRARSRAGEAVEPPDPASVEHQAQRARALRHALAEFELRVHRDRTGPVDRRGPGMTPSVRSRLGGSPTEGWISLALVALMAVVGGLVAR